jgi:membrane-associated phospholipid phosphatase
MATAATATTFYLRYRGGFHFVDDLIIGSLVGAAAGILVPTFHKHKIIVTPENQSSVPQAVCFRFTF